jgi:phospholipase C
VGNIVNEIGAIPKLWNHSVIVVVWDDWGGWYDPAGPPTLDFRGFGIRTPMLIISPYAKTTQNSATVSTELMRGAPFMSDAARLGICQARNQTSAAPTTSM